MSVRVVVVCEDNMHQALVRHFLKKMGVHRRAIRYVNLPSGKGAGTQHVQHKFSQEIISINKRISENIILLGVMDTDEKTVTQRRRDFFLNVDSGLIKKEMLMDKIFTLCPQRNIESWLYYMREFQIIDSNKDYKKELSRDECGELIDKLYRSCSESRQMPNMPGSLSDACVQYQRLRDKIR